MECMTSVIKTVTIPTDATASTPIAPQVCGSVNVITFQVCQSDAANDRSATTKLTKLGAHTAQGMTNQLPVEE